MKTRYLLLLSILVPSASEAQTIRALGVDDVIELAGLGTTHEARADLIRSSCVRFPLDAATTNQLRAGGVSQELISVVETACFAGAELVVESESPGAEVFVDGARVGTTPWTGRFVDGGTRRVTVRSGSRSHDANVSLRTGQRSRALFAFTEELRPVPGVRSADEIAAELGVERHWQPAVPRPSEPSYPGSYGGPISWAVNLGGMYAGYRYCQDATHHCAIDPDIDDDGDDLMEPVRLMVGAGGGLIAGLVVNGIIGKVVNSVRQGSYRSAVERRAEWDRSNAIARASWARAHPDVLAQRQREQEAREQAEAWNRGVRERNAAREPVRVTSEPLPGPAGR